MSCPDENRLAAFVHHGLEAAERRAVEEHVAHCDVCCQTVAILAEAPRHAPSEVPLDVSGSGVGAAGTAPHTFRPGQEVGRYRVIREVGAGAMGVVYEARDPNLARPVALKVLSATLRSEADASTRLLREAQTMAQLSHPNVVTVFDVGTHDGHVFLAMEFVDGQTLEDWLRSGRPWADAVRAMMQAAEGLSAAHEAGLVHRDFKPSNALISSDLRVRVTDFGLARPTSELDSGGALVDAEVSDSTSLTRTGTMVGTLGYMAPEQIQGQELDARVDQFAFCVTLYQALFGERPFHGRTALERLVSITNGVAVPQRKGLPPALRDILRRGLSARPEERFASMRELNDALSRTLQPTRRVSLTAASGFALALALVLSSVAVLRSRERPAQVTAPPPVATVTAVQQPVVEKKVSQAPAPVEATAKEPDRPAPVVSKPSKRTMAHPPAAVAGTGILSVHVSPWGEVSVDGQQVSSQNLMDFVAALTAGKHQLVVRHPALGERTFGVVIAPGKTLEKQVHFE